MVRGEIILLGCRFIMFRHFHTPLCCLPTPCLILEPLHTKVRGVDLYTYLCYMDYSSCLIAIFWRLSCLSFFFSATIWHLFLSQVPLLRVPIPGIFSMECFDATVHQGVLSSYFRHLAERCDIFCLGLRSDTGSNDKRFSQTTESMFEIRWEVQ